MSINLKGTSDNDSCIVKARTVRRLSVIVRTAVNAGGAASLPALENVTLKCVLHRDGQKFPIFQDSLRILALESMFFGCIEQLQNPSYMNIMNDGVFAPPRVYAQQLMIDLGSPINLQGRDELHLEATANQGWLTGAAATSSFTSSSTIAFKWRDEIGVETFIPTINSHYITATHANFKRDLGDNVTSIAFINTQGQLPAGYVNDSNAIIRHMSLATDRYDLSDTIDEMIARRNMQFPTQQQAWFRANSWFVDLPGEVDRCSVDLLLNPQNVLTSANAIVYRSYIVHARTVNRAASIVAKHEQRNAAKLQAELAKA
jgi:hypothetical protein